MISYLSCKCFISDSIYTHNYKISYIYKKRLCHYSASSLFIQCICTTHPIVHLQWKFGEALYFFIFFLFYFFFKFWTVATIQGSTVAIVVTVFFFFFLSSVCLLYILFYWHNKFHNIFTIIDVSISYKPK